MTTANVAVRANASAVQEVCVVTSIFCLNEVRVDVVILDGPGLLLGVLCCRHHDAQLRCCQSSLSLYP